MKQLRMRALLVLLIFTAVTQAQESQQVKNFVKGADVGFLQGQERRGIVFRDRNGRERECLELLKNDYQPQAIFLRSAKNMPRRIKTVPNRNQRVICSLSIHQAKTMVVRGLK